MDEIFLIRSEVSLYRGESGGIADILSRIDSRESASDDSIRRIPTHSKDEFP